MTVYEAVPPELEALDQWICWRNECRECETWHEHDYKGECTECGADEVTKVPKDPETGRNAIPGNRSTWTDFETAKAYDENHDTHGLGFMFSEDDEIVGVDIDDCVDPETGEIDADAQDILATLHSWSEYSTSGTGVHIIAFGEVPEGRSRSGDGVEMYDKERYFAITADEVDRTPASINYRQEQIESVHGGYVESAGASGPAPSEIDFDVEVRSADEIEDEFENDLGQSLEEIRSADGKLDALLDDMNPDGDYDSPSEADFATAAKLWWYRFDHQQITDIFQVHRYRPKAERPDTYLGAAVGEREDPRSFGDIEILSNRSEYQSIENVDWPDHCFVLEKPPREGGSHSSMDVLSESPLVVLASRHAICEHHLDILRDVMPDGKTAVHFKGTSRACRHGSGEESCSKWIQRSENIEGIYEIIHEVDDARAKNRVVTAEDCPERFCPKQFLNYAAAKSWAVVTVPTLLPDLDNLKDNNLLQEGLGWDNLLIDEEQALDYFRPPSANLATFETVYDPDGARHVRASESNITTQLDTLRDICQGILEDRQERAKDGETDRFQKLDKEEDVLRATDYLKRAAQKMSIEDIDGNPTAGEVASEIRDRLDDIPVPDPNLSPSDFRSGIEEYVERYYFDDAVDPGAMLESVLFGYEDRKFDFKNTPGGYKLRMVGGRQVFHPDILLDFDQIGVIAGPEGELFFDDLGLGDLTEVIEINDFRYADDFVILPVGKEQEDRMEPPSAQRDRPPRVSDTLNRRAHPHLAVTGTKAQAKKHHARLDSGVADIISNPESPAKDTYTTWTAGGSAIIYENSAVSRGIDTPYFDVIVVASSGFAAPYWEARAAHYNGEDDAEYEYAKAIETQLKSHELTNAVLRPAPTRHIDHHTGTKFVVCADWDANRLKYLHQELPTFSRSETAANFLENLTIGGALRENIDDVYWSLDESESDFIEAAMDGVFREVKNERVDYSIDELETWVEKRYMTREGVVDDVENAIPPRGEVDLDFLTNLFNGWSNGKVYSSLEVLEREGVIESFTEESDSKGRPKTLWRKTGFKSEDG